MIPPSFIQELLHRTDIVDLIDGYVTLKKAGGNYTACCPFHSEKTPSFSVSPSKQFYHCFGCGQHGSAITFMMEYSGMGFIDAVKDLAAKAGLQMPEREAGKGFSGGQETHRISNLTEVMAQAAQYYRDQLKVSPKAIEYLKNRGLSGEIAQKFGIGYVPNGWQNLEAIFKDYNHADLQTAGLVIKNEQGNTYDRFRDRIMFPIVNQKGEIIAFGGRVIGADEPKYLNSPETPLFEKGREVFGLPQARLALREKNTAIVVEGYMDVVALAQHGISNSVATLGTATTATHVQKLLRQVDRIVYCFDGDQAGRKAAWRALENSLEALPEQKTISFVLLPESEDPDSYVRKHGKAAFEQLISEATPLSEFMLRTLASQCDMTSSEGRTKLLVDATPLLNKLQSPLLRLQIAKRLSEISGFSQADVEQQCKLKPVAKAAPTPVSRPVPSLLKPLLRLLLQKPDLARRLPVNLVDDVLPEARAVKSLCELILSTNDTIPDYVSLIELLRGSEDEKTFRDAAGEIMRQPFADDLIDLEFDGILERLVEAEKRRNFLALHAKVAKVGSAGLSSEEKAEFLQSIANQRRNA